MIRGIRRFFSRAPTPPVGVAMTPVHDPNLNLLLDQLYHEARLAPTDPLKQMNLYRALNQARRFDDVRARYELNTFASSPEVTAQYEEAVRQIAAVKVSQARPSTFWGRLTWVAALATGFGIFYFPRSTSSGSQEHSDQAPRPPHFGGGTIGQLFQSNHQRVDNVPDRFSDVIGCDEAKADLEEVVQYLQDPDRFLSLGAKMPKGILLHGPPGTGKTLLARAVAGEAGVSFYYASASGFDEMLVGVGARRIRDLFRSAADNAPCIVFIDELDAVGQKRSNRLTGHDGTLNTLLTEMDGFRDHPGVMVLAATNRVDTLDGALLRAGRFDKKIAVPPPDRKARADLWQLYLGKIVAAPDIDVASLAAATPGLTPADIANTCNQAALKAGTRAQDHVTQADVLGALDDLRLGGRNLNQISDEQARRDVAFHEAGHAVVAFYLPDSRPIQKMTTLNRGQALGHVSFVERSSQLATRQQMLAEITTAMGGRVAEELMNGANVTIGASSDLQSASTLARQMIYTAGMGDRLTVVPVDEQIQLVSSETRHELEAKVEALLQQCYDDAKKILLAKRAKWELLANTCLERGEMSIDEIYALLEPEKRLDEDPRYSYRKPVPADVPAPVAIPPPKPVLRPVPRPVPQHKPGVPSIPAFPKVLRRGTPPTPKPETPEATPEAPAPVPIPGPASNPSPSPESKPSASPEPASSAPSTPSLTPSPAETPASAAETPASAAETPVRAAETPASPAPTPAKSTDVTELD